MEIDSTSALIGAVQMGTIELHTWSATHEQVETPDLFVLDLDPDPALPWKSMLEATQLTLSVLDELGLQAFLKTSGGKGMHLIVPLARKDDWDRVKGFAKAIAQFMAQQLPERITATMGPKTGSARSSSITCATPAAPAPWRPTRCGHARGCRSRCLSHGTSWMPSAMPSNGMWRTSGNVWKD